jgi:hypothetical protein
LNFCSINRAYLKFWADQAAPMRSLIHLALPKNPQRALPGQVY